MTQQQSSAEALLDRARDVRDDERFDIARTDAWLKSQVDGLMGAPEVQQFAGGASNLTYLVRYPGRDLILRRPPFGHKAKGAHDLAREFRIQEKLKRVYPATPTMVALCEDPEVMGCDFYVMDRISGIIPRANLPKGLTLSKQQVSELCRNYVDKFVELHQVDYRAAGLEDIGKGDGYVKRQILGWEDRCGKSLTWNAPSWKYVIAWLKERMPADVGTVVIHNDYRMDNVVLSAEEPTSVIGVLDWEMATLGDPLMDLGNTLTYWIQADDSRLQQGLRRQPTHLPGMMTRREVVEYYCDRMNLKPDNWVFYEVYGMFRFAVILQQIYYRYHHKQSTNPAFKHFWFFNQYLYWRSRTAIRKHGRS